MGNATVIDAVRMIEASREVALDLETTGLNARRDAIRLVQVSDGEKIFVVDLFRVSDARPLFEALAAAPVVIAHGGAFEYGFVYAKYGIALDNLVDTLLLARVAATGDMTADCGLGVVAERELGIELDKDMQRTDWSGDLTRRQLKYAAMDVKVLPPLYKILSKIITETDQERVTMIEHEALPAVARMRLEGLPVDKAAWNAHAARLAGELEALRVEKLDAAWLPERDPVPS